MLEGQSHEREAAARAWMGLSIGSLIVAFMAVTQVLLEPLGLTLPRRFPRLVAWQPVLFGAGQSVFAAGFALAGAAGMARKVYGVEQVRTATQTAGLAVMGLGGIVAVAGGLLFCARRSAGMP